MRLHLDKEGGTFRITGYGEGYIAVNEEKLTESTIVTPDQLVYDWPPQRYDELTVAHMEVLSDMAPEILILGTGGRQHFLPPFLIAPFAAKSVGFEVMDTAAACRTYNILMSEGRAVVAALMMIHR